MIACKQDGFTDYRKIDSYERDPDAGAFVKIDDYDWDYYNNG
ncbi:hypothetical protein PAJ34TS1_43050 [Paenibacillus azoreducens]|uniref:Uncharacterized protein n=1 Tax=Paenibacillus azoreducens TaxID=116718 RepID=A0A919YK63_9BACL|nr:hypothetical protein J34TS1_45570 [Paenibacillus azoreducens]